MEEHLLENCGVAAPLTSGAILCGRGAPLQENIVEDARIIVGSAACRPLTATDAAKSLEARTLDQQSIEEAAALAARIAKPLDNTDFDMTWRKRVTAEFVTYALRELRGEDVRAEREKLHSLSLQLVNSGFSSISAIPCSPSLKRVGTFSIRDGT